MKPVRSRPPMLVLLLSLVGLGALVSVPAASAADQPSFQCRASALAVSLTDQPYIEPLVANGIKGSVPGPTFDKALCTNDEQGAADLTNSAGLQGLIGTTAVKVKTTITPELGSSAAQTAPARTEITDLDVRLGATPSQLLQVGAVQASATGRCVNGKAEFTGTSQITNIRLLGVPITLDGLLQGIQNLLDQTGLSAVAKITALNQVTKTADGVTVTPLRIQVLPGVGTGGVIDLTIGETKVAQRGDACNPPAINPDNPDDGGDGICPVGSIPVGQGPRVCQIPATDRYGLVVIGVPNSTDTPRGGRVLPLPEARRLAAAGQLPNSRCLTGAGLNYVVLGDSGTDRIYGTKNRDRMLGLGGKDNLHGLDAADCLDGGTAADRLYGGTGSDRLYGGSGSDQVYGHTGNDQLYGGASRDRLYGDKGNDTIRGESGNDLILGGQGNDTALGASGNGSMEYNMDSLSVNTLQSFSCSYAYYLPVGFTVRVDAMNAVGGPYAKAILEGELGAPAGTVVPSGAMISARTPATGLGTSTETLSVSNSHSISSSFTTSPGFLNHVDTVASVTLSPSEGTITSIITICSLSQGVVDEGCLFGFVFAGQTRGGRGRGDAPSIARAAEFRANLDEQGFNLGFNKRPRAGVFRFFLAPDEFGVFEAAQLFGQWHGRHRVQLFDAHQIGVAQPTRIAFGQKVVVNLARTQNHALDLVIG